MNLKQIRNEIQATTPTGLTTHQLATKYGVTYKQMANLLAGHGFLAGVDYELDTPQQPITNWNEVDWSLSNSELASRLGCHRWTVARQRAKRGNRDE